MAGQEAKLTDHRATGAAPSALFMNHGIAHDEEGSNRTVGTAFIDRNVFHDG